MFHGHLGNPKVGEILLKYKDLPSPATEPNYHIIHADGEFLSVHFCQVVMGFKVESASVYSRYPNPDRMSVAQVEAKFGLQGLTVDLVDEVQDGPCQPSSSYQLYQLHKISETGNYGVPE